MSLYFNFNLAKTESSPVNSVGREEIDEVEKNSTEIGRQRSKKRRMQQVTTVHGRPPGRPMQEPVDCPVDRCARGAQTRNVRPPGQLLPGSGRPPDRPTERSQVPVGDGRPARSTVAWVGRPAGRPKTCFLLAFIDSDSFSDWDRIQSGFPNTLGLCGYK